MTTILKPPDLQRSYAVSADWLEILAMSRPDGCATDSDILQPNDILEDRATPMLRAIPGGVDDDPDILDHAADSMLDAIFQEIATRWEVLGENYPFRLTISREHLRLELAQPSSDPFTEQGRLIYLACLYMSAIRANLIDARAGRIKVDPTIGNLFQICATIAAAGYIGGDAYWFGAPRPDQTTMLDAVRRLTELLRFGTASLQTPQGESLFAKDGGIDVVAWRDHHDGRPAKLILYGQCASGMGWDNKPVHGKVSRLDGYFTRTPSKWFLPALLTPFPIYMDKEASHNLRTEDDRKSFYRHNESEMGIILDRLRIVRWAVEGLRTPQPIMRDAVGRLSDLFAWATEASAAVRAV